MVTMLSGKMNRILLFIFAALAMNIMNALSVCIGSVFPYLMPKIVISFVVIVLFLGFGLKLLYDVVTNKEEDHGEESELEE